MCPYYLHCLLLITTLPREADAMCSLNIKLNARIPHLKTGAALHLQLCQRLPVLEVGQLPGVEPLAERLHR